MYQEKVFYVKFFFCRHTKVKWINLRAATSFQVVRRENGMNQWRVFKVRQKCWIEAHKYIVCFICFDRIMFIFISVKRISFLSLETLQLDMMGKMANMQHIYNIYNLLFVGIICNYYWNILWLLYNKDEFVLNISPKDF